MKPLQKTRSTRFFAKLSLVLLKIICGGYLLESPPRGDSDRSPQHMVLWRNFHFLSFNTNPRFPPFLLYVRCKSGVTFVWRCFRHGFVFYIVCDSFKRRAGISSINKTGACYTEMCSSTIYQLNINQPKQFFSTNEGVHLHVQILLLHVRLHTVKTTLTNISTLAQGTIPLLLCIFIFFYKYFFYKYIY